MKRGRYYVPLFLLLIFNIIFNGLIENWVGFFGWVTSLFLLCEVYYLRFLK